MKITLISDTHLGYGKNTEIEEDAFEALEESISKSRDADLILLAGDIFDTRTPDTETIVRCMEILLDAHMENNRVKLTEAVGKDIGNLPRSAYSGIPVVAIHGTHERRPKGLLNPVAALEKAGFLVYLHCNGVVFEKDGEKVCVQGMSAVPDQYAESVLSEWNPKPVRNCFNILVLHQSVSGIVLAKNLLHMERIPGGFDLYVLGHIHEPRVLEHAGKPMIVTGSAVSTQIRSCSVGGNVFWEIDTEKQKIENIPYEKQRKVYVLEGTPDGKIEREMENILKEKHSKKPIIKIVSERISPEFRMRYEGRAILHMQKVAGDMEELKRVELKEHRLGVQDMGRKMLWENLKKSGLDTKIFESVFELLLEKKEGEALDVIKHGDMKDMTKPQPDGKTVSAEGAAAKALPRVSVSGDMMEALEAGVKAIETLVLAEKEPVVKGAVISGTRPDILPSKDSKAVAKKKDWRSILRPVD